MLCRQHPGVASHTRGRNSVFPPLSPVLEMTRLKAPGTRIRWAGETGQASRGVHPATGQLQICPATGSNVGLVGRGLVTSGGTFSTSFKTPLPFRVCHQVFISEPEAGRAGLSRWTPGSVFDKPSAVFALGQLLFLGASWVDRFECGF